jgi:choline dehydrogenase-like flavoprotein
VSARRGRDDGETCPQQIGATYKEAMTEPGPWQVYSYIQGETIPKETNHVRLSTDQKDEWGIPLLVTSVDYDDNDEKLLKDFFVQTEEMLTKAGVKNIYHRDSKQAPGLDIHEMGGCRMGTDPEHLCSITGMHCIIAKMFS